MTNVDEDALPPEWMAVTGCILTGWCFCWSVQQACVSSIMEHPVIRYRYYTAWYCTNSFIAAVMVYFHYQDPHDKSLVTGIRLFVALSLLVGSLVSYVFFIESINALYRSRANADGAPKWFVKAFDIIIMSVVFSLAICWIVSYSTQTGAGFWIFYVLLNFALIGGGIVLLWAIVPIRKQIKVARVQILKAQSTMDVTLRAPSTDTTPHPDDTDTNGNTSTNPTKVVIKQKSVDLEKGQTVPDSTPLPEEVVNDFGTKLKRLMEGKFKMDAIIVSILLIMALTVYSQVTYLFWSDISDAELYESPYPTVGSYLTKALFDVFYDLMLIFWSYKRTKCCTELTPDTIFFLCCPACDRSGAAQAHLDQLYAVNDMEMDDLHDMQGVMDNLGMGKPKNNNNTKNENVTGQSDKNNNPNEDKKTSNTVFNDKVIRAAINEIQQREKIASQREQTQNSKDNNNNNNNDNDDNNGTGRPTEPVPQPQVEEESGGVNRRPTNAFQTPPSQPQDAPPQGVDFAEQAPIEKRNTITGAPSTFDPANLVGMRNNNDDDGGNGLVRIRVVIYDFEHIILANHRSFYKNTVPTVKAMPVDDMITKLGGENRIDMLRQHLDYICNNQGCLLFLMTREYSQVIYIILEKLQLLHYFVSSDYKTKLRKSKNGKKPISPINSDLSDVEEETGNSDKYNDASSKGGNNSGNNKDKENGNNNDNDNNDIDKEEIAEGMELAQRILGWDNKLMSNHSNGQSRNVAILTIMKLTNCLYDELLYIDNDASTLEHINRINLCRTYQMIHRKGLTKIDINSIQNSFFWQ